MDSNKFPPATSVPGTLHYIPKNLCAFEPSKPLTRNTNINTLLWVGGMFDTLHSVSYPFKIAEALPPTWSLVTASLSSAGHSWGVSSIAKDAEDMAKIISYLKEKRPGGKVVIMGHSTGCQDCMEYLVGKGHEKRPNVDGIILQAPVSDREALDHELPAAMKQEADQLAMKMCRERNGNEYIPNRLTRPVFGRLAVTAKRWLDVSSPGPDHNGADDYFSSGHSVERLKRTFGQLTSKTPLLVLYSGSEENVSDSVDKEKLVDTWIGVVKSAGGVVAEGSGIVPGATHNLNGNPDEVVQDLVKRVVDYTGTISGTGAGPSRM
ncbi:Fusarinine C esterase sidJ [Pseudocercospora fuligena]|uniref:Fusarinine C esterase sidJ n=1 Tax=Pseudocercospora fuligena TaxID=685502 RepID=A0A8H6RMF2_9PEZI|nr:Fusarinine C esterase sidJ [Pseudocercospora fuligena]